MALASVFALSFPLAGEARSAGLEVNYGIAARATYDDNIYLDSEEEKSDVIYNLIPSLDASHDGASTDLRVSYSLDYAFYRNRKEENRTKPRDIQRLFSELNIGEGEGLSLKLSEEIKRVTLDEALKSTESNDLVNRTNRYLFTARPSLLLVSGRGSTVEIGYTYRNISYVSDRGDDSEEHSGDLLLKKKVSEESELLLKAGASRKDSTKVEDLKKFHCRAGAARKVDGFSFSADGGIERLYFEESGVESLGVWSVEARFPLFAESSTGFRFSQEAGAAETGNVHRHRVYGADAKLSGKRTRVSLSAGWSESDYLREDRQDVEKSIGAAADWSITSSLAGAANARYAHLEVSPSDETKERYQAGLSLKLSGNRTALTISYGFRCDDSTVGKNDFVSNTASLEFSGKF